MTICLFAKSDGDLFFVRTKKLEKHRIVKVIKPLGNKGMNNEMSVNNYFIKCTSIQKPFLNKA